MSDATPEGSHLPEAENELPGQAARPAPLDDYPEIQLTTLDSHVTSEEVVTVARSDDEAVPFIVHLITDEPA